MSGWPRTATRTAQQAAQRWDDHLQPPEQRADAAKLMHAPLNRTTKALLMSIGGRISADHAEACEMLLKAWMSTPIRA